MRIEIYNVLNKISDRIRGLAFRIYSPPVPPPSKEELRVLTWNKANGDKTLRLDYDLTDKSVVFDVGGYEGQWAADIYCRYSCNVYIFEPIKKFAKEIENRFRGNKKVHVFSYGLSGKDGKAKISLEENESSIFKESDHTEEIQLKSTVDFMQQDNITFIDLMKLNIEGGEYEVLESLVASGRISDIRFLQIQFHDFAPDAEKRRDKIKTELQKTHRQDYDFPFVWEGWSLKK